mmetsp:Transcript_19757/g.51040  ORF Transcript_19757/g.51040 Transcript_19757/m.51040 type:complete len:167 (-) Transcript_19757:99-599(-)
MDYTGSSYEGDIVNGRLEGKGKYVFPSGTTYVGDFKDGEFHGEGMLVFPDCGKFTGTWERGVVVTGEYAFKDGLLYEDGKGGEWKYCNGEDRRFFRETIEGLRPTGDEQLTNDHPAVEIPKGMYDIGRGVFNPSDGNVYSYDHELIGKPAESEEWILAMCRKGTQQ